MNLRARVILGLVALVPAIAARAADLPSHLVLHYRVRYGTLDIGEVTKTLDRLPDGHYRHTTRTLPTGIARVFTNVTFVEQGVFHLEGSRIVPDRFSDTKRGDGHDYVRTARFDYATHKLDLGRHGVVPLPPGAQDLNTIFYAFMLNPPTPGMTREVPVTNGKDIHPYYFLYRGRTTLPTPLGPLVTDRVSRLSDTGYATYRRCKPGDTACTAITRRFEIWVAPALDGIAAQIVRTEHGRTLTLVLDHVSR